ncbi:MAG: hypothetical protein CM1200mP29_15170 [Verrucomicrobiota bacterium]|nr:MAG: hypothetical protein CM1200mP29_15170 [Verrucomicrobiota bacterium]
MGVEMDSFADSQVCFLISGPDGHVCRWFILRGILLLAFAWLSAASVADDFQQKLQPIFPRALVKCHGGEKVRARST